MPYQVVKTVDGKFKVLSPQGVKAKGTSLRKALRQRRLLQSIKHGFRPSR